MTVLESLFLNALFILFPIFVYFLFAANHGLGKRSEGILFDLAMYSSLYLLLRCETPYIGIKIMFLTVPLLIAYLKNKKIMTIIFSICIALYYIYYIDINIISVVIEFIIYLIFMYVLKKRNESDVTLISVFAIVKIAFMILQLDSISLSYYDMMKQVIIFPFAFYFTTHLICHLMASSERIMNLHMTLKEVEKQKQLRDSLFKITHEIKNPIAVCKGYLDMFDINNPDHVKRYIPIIKQEIERTLTLMHDFLMLTKLNADKKRMDLSVLLQDVYDMSKMIFKDKKIDFLCSSIDQEIYIDGDYDRLKQVFLNIMKNAAEAIPNNKKGIIKFKVKESLKELIITISDNGVGMSKENLSKIGEPFYTTKQYGTGLGVKFSKEIIEIHDGSIEYKSKLNVGTTVIIKLPLKKSL